MRKNYSKVRAPQGKTPEETQQEAVRRAMGLLLYRDRSEQELKGRLEEDGYTPQDIRAALEYVSSFGYLNDRRFAENYVYKKGKTQSRAFIGAELRRLGVDEHLIEEALEESPWSEGEVMAELLRKRYGEEHPLDQKELRRAWGYLGRRGFPPADIRRSLTAYQS